MSFRNLYINNFFDYCLFLVFFFFFLFFIFGVCGRHLQTTEYFKGVAALNIIYHIQIKVLLDMFVFFLSQCFSCPHFTSFPWVRNALLVIRKVICCKSTMFAVAHRTILRYLNAPKRSVPFPFDKNSKIDIDEFGVYIYLNGRVS